MHVSLIVEFPGRRKVRGGIRGNPSLLRIFPAHFESDSIFLLRQLAFWKGKPLQRLRGLFVRSLSIDMLSGREPPGLIPALSDMVYWEHLIETLITLIVHSIHLLKVPIEVLKSFYLVTLILVLLVKIERGNLSGGIHH